MIEVDRISKSFRRHKQKGKSRWHKDAREGGKWFYAVRNVTFRAEAGTILGLLGPNGAGKTTLLRMLSTALKPSEGTARFDGVEVDGILISYKFSICTEKY
ncbi:unnamed protein product [marine sediment metagenome]|uniref:ABC transporter domain-containing protein n=1 Tax=marine sediment metagenome TaxID=412755 RepID=X1MEI0_9ZZZZ